MWGVNRQIIYIYIYTFIPFLENFTGCLHDVQIIIRLHNSDILVLTDTKLSNMSNRDWMNDLLIMYKWWQSFLPNGHGSLLASK
jgi:hypothetical protein